MLKALVDITETMEIAHGFVERILIVTNVHVRLEQIIVFTIMKWLKENNDLVEV